MLLLIFLKSKNWKQRLILLTIYVLLIIITYLHFEENLIDVQKTGMVIESHDNYYLVVSQLKRYYVYEANNTKEIGDIICLNGSIKPLQFKTYESAFNFQTYLNQKGVYSQFYVNDENYKIHTIFRIKSLKNILLNRLNDESRIVCNKILFNNVDDNVSNQYSNIKLFYLFSCSGVHISFIINLIEKALSKLKIKQEKITIISSILTFLILILFSFKLSILRVLIRKIISIFNKIEKKYNRLELMMITFYILLFIDFHYIYSTSFVIGFIYSFFRIICDESILIKKKIYKKIVITIIMFFISCLLCSYLYGEVNLSSIILLPILSICMPVLIGFCLFCYLFGFSKLIVCIGKTYDFIVSFCNKVSLNIVVGKYSIVIIICFVILILLMIYVIELQSYKQAKVVTLGIVILFAISVFPLNNYFIDSISFINVGQGDSILLIHNKESLLIDTGGNQNIDLATESLIPYFKKNHLNSIDNVIITHSDSDHNGSLASLQQHFKVKNVIYQTTEYFSLMGIDFHNLNYDYEIGDSNNDKSIVLHFKFLEKYFVLMGDAEQKVEQKIMTHYENIMCDYLKIGHHGSSSSTSEKFLKFLNPKEAIVSVGIRNSYHHPSDSVISLLNQYQVKIRRTDEEGTIKYSKIKKI